MCTLCVVKVHVVKESDQSVVGFTPVNSRTPSSRRERSGKSRSRETPSREERKEATRRAINAAALKLLDERSFSGLSLREVTREAGIVPAAFYRHFESMDALGLVLIDESIPHLARDAAQRRAGQARPEPRHRVHGRHPGRRGGPSSVSTGGSSGASAPAA